MLIFSFTAKNILILQRKIVKVMMTYTPSVRIETRASSGSYRRKIKTILITLRIIYRKIRVFLICK